MEFIEVCRKREATRKFSDVKIESDVLNKILEVGRLAPTAKNLQPQKILVVKSNEGLEKIDKASPCRYNAPVVLMVCSDKSVVWHNDDFSTYEMDAVIVATHLMLAATNYGVDNIWIEMFDKDILKKEFNIDKNIEVVCLIPMGYRTDDYLGNPMHGKRKELDEMVEFV